MADLTALQVKALTRPGRHSVGSGLYLDIDANGNRSWMFRYQLTGKRTWMGLGPYHDRANTLAIAKAKVIEARRLINTGEDPVEHNRQRKELETQQRAIEKSATEVYTFKSCADDWFRHNEAGWLNPKHKEQIRNTLRDYVHPHLGDMAVADVGLADIRKCLDPIWTTKTETASRVRQRIEAVLSFALVNGKRVEANPAIWRGFLDNIYPAPETVKRNLRFSKGREKHFKALPYAELPAFYAALCNQAGIAALALKFTILTAVRSGAVRSARWDEIDLVTKTWTIPAVNMKNKKEFRAALSTHALEVIRPLMGLGDIVFPGEKVGKALSSNAMLALLKRMGLKGLTVHGFRSTFRDYIGEATNLDPLIAEYALAHVVGDSTERAYARGDQLAKRYHMMEQWGDYVTRAIYERDS